MAHLNTLPLMCRKDKREGDTIVYTLKGMPRVAGEFPPPIRMIRVDMLIKRLHLQPTRASRFCNSSRVGSLDVFWHLGPAVRGSGENGRGCWFVEVSHQRMGEFLSSALPSTLGVNHLRRACGELALELHLEQLAQNFLDTPQPPLQALQPQLLQPQPPHLQQPHGQTQVVRVTQQAHVAQTSVVAASVVPPTPRWHVLVLATTPDGLLDVDARGPSGLLCAERTALASLSEKLEGSRPKQTRQKRNQPEKQRRQVDEQPRGVTQNELCAAARESAEGASVDASADARLAVTGKYLDQVGASRGLLGQLHALRYGVLPGVDSRGVVVGDAIAEGEATVIDVANAALFAECIGATMRMLRPAVWDDVATDTQPSPGTGQAPPEHTTSNKRPRK